jgi:hypothetical protein
MTNIATKNLAEEIKSWGLYHESKLLFKLHMITRSNFNIFTFLFLAYWCTDLNSWGSLCDWDLYFIDKNPECTKEAAHQSLSLELDILLKKLPNRSLQYFNANVLKKALKVSAFLIIMLHDRNDRSTLACPAVVF